MEQLRREKMTSAERINALLAGRKMDRALVWLWVVTPGFAVRNAGYPLETSYNDPEKSFQAQLWTTEMYGDDGIPRMAVGGTCDVTWAFGGEIKWPTGEYEMAPSVTRYPVTSEADARELKLPADVKTAGPIPLYLEFAKLQERSGLPISIFITSPIEGARSFCGPEMLCRWLIKKPELAHRLLRLATDYSVKVTQYWAETFDPARILIYNAAPTGSNQIISPKQFETFVLPYQKELHEKILSMGIRYIFCHICGEQNLNLPYWAQIPMGGPGIVSFGHEVDLTAAVEFFGETCIIAGNIEPAAIHTGTHEEVYELCRQAIEKGKQAPHGYILMPGCGLPPMAPPYNVYMMKKAIEDFGWYK